jgi:hypothetical protein
MPPTEQELPSSKDEGFMVCGALLFLVLCILTNQLLYQLLFQRDVFVLFIMSRQKCTPDLILGNLFLKFGKFKN